MKKILLFPLAALGLLAGCDSKGNGSSNKPQELTISASSFDESEPGCVGVAALAYDSWDPGDILVTAPIVDGGFTLTLPLPDGAEQGVSMAGLFEEMFGVETGLEDVKGKYIPVWLLGLNVDGDLLDVIITPWNPGDGPMVWVYYLYSDRDIAIRKEVERANGEVHYDVDLKLKAGWNLFVEQSLSDPETDKSNNQITSTVPAGAKWTMLGI